MKTTSYQVVFVGFLLTSGVKMWVQTCFDFSTFQAADAKARGLAFHDPRTEYAVLTTEETITPITPTR